MGEFFSTQLFFALLMSGDFWALLGFHTGLNMGLKADFGKTSGFCGFEIECRKIGPQTYVKARL